MLHIFSAIEYSDVKTNVTVAIDAELAQAAKVLAARRGTSLSRLVADQLETLVECDQAYEIAKRRAVRRLRKGTNLGWSKPASRDEIHER